MGTKQDTYRAPGIVSQLSKDRQTDGPIEIVTSDQGGNLATDGGFVFDKIDEFDDHFTQVDRRLDQHDKRIDENKSGVALAISIENPDLIGNERFGVAMNYGNFEGASALSWSAMGVLGYDVLSRGDRVAVSGGFGVGFEEGGRRRLGRPRRRPVDLGSEACAIRLEIGGPKNDDGRPGQPSGRSFFVRLPVQDDELLHLKKLAQALDRACGWLRAGAPQGC